MDLLWRLRVVQINQKSNSSLNHRDRTAEENELRVRLLVQSPSEILKDHVKRAQYRF